MYVILSNSEVSRQTIYVIAKERSDCGNPTEKARNIYSVDLHPPGRLLRYARKDKPRVRRVGEVAATPPIGDKKYGIKPTTIYFLKK